VLRNSPSIIDVEIALEVRGRLFVTRWSIDIIRKKGEHLGVVAARPNGKRTSRR
jgi:hypothetical protein